MKLPSIACIAALLLACSLVAVPAGFARQQRNSIAGLLPISDQDMSRTHERGCNFSFDSDNGTRVFAVGRDLMVRTPKGLSVCRLGEAQVDKFIAGKHGAVCGGRSLLLRKLSPTTPHEESDSASWRAALTVTQGRTSRIVRGTAGTAC